MKTIRILAVAVIATALLTTTTGCKCVKSFAPDSWNVTYYHPFDGRVGDNGQIGIGVSGPLPWAAK